HQALRLNPLKSLGEAQKGMESVYQSMAERFNVTPVSWEDNGYYYGKEEQPGRYPYHAAGVYYIQEPSAMAVVPLMEVQPGERVLDLCAAPGGKSTQIAGYLQGEGLLISNEIHAARAKILSENIERMGVANACVTNETPTRLSERFPEYFDKILVDAPCSGEGMFRKSEVACEEWSLENVELCAARQDEILDCAAKMLRPGGRLVYSTCTFAPQENEGSISRFLARHTDFVLLPIDKVKLGLREGVCDGRPEWTSYDLVQGDLRNTLRLWPHYIKGEGHFAAVLQKAGDLPEGYEPIPTGGSEQGISGRDKSLAEWWEFWKALTGEMGLNRQGGRSMEGDADKQRFLADALGVSAENGSFLWFGEQLYWIPKEMPALKGMKVLRPGLHLGTMKKNRFEPAHALALALNPAKIQHVCQLSTRDSLIAAYLNGQTFPYEGEKGWYLVTVDGYGVGWGKLAGGIMKNHYPKGLRQG
ncbi:MAG: RsmB/NOP family class I SAM-dependent RNA methyltransferase, partial [Butyrivibrio sp.]|nr:RsmB/NOP family class I SAM-dependent RNA methyltransferase [Butyrivibrio sp.]